jgi:hypothetical protein
MACIGCIAGVISIDEYRQGLTDADFSHVVAIDAKADLNTSTLRSRVKPGAVRPAPRLANRAAATKRKLRFANTLADC